MRILSWNTHGGWMNGFVRGHHDYLLPVDRDGKGGRSWRPWPANVRDIRDRVVIDADVDVIVAHDLAQLNQIEELTGRKPGHDVATIFVEHNLPEKDIPGSRHPLAGQRAIPVVHVTQFNALMWDNGRGRSQVIEHGIPDPGYHYTGDVRAAATVIDEPLRDPRATGTDLLADLSRPMRIDLFGSGGHGVADALDIDSLRLMYEGSMRQPRLFRELARRRVYVHTHRWTSLAIPLLEAMACGMPVVGVAATEMTRAVPREAGLVSAHPGELAAALGRFGTNQEAATTAGLVAREFVLRYYGLQQFHERWDELLEDTLTRVNRRRALLPRKQKTSPPVVAR